MSIKKYIKITGCLNRMQWYFNRIGDVFEVKELSPKNIEDWILVWTKKGDNWGIRS